MSTLTCYCYWKQSIPHVLFLFRNIKSHHNIVLINLCVALIFANVTFIVGIEWTEPKVSKSKQQCFPVTVSCLVKYNSILLIQKCKFADYQLFLEYFSFLSNNFTPDLYGNRNVWKWSSLHFSNYLKINITVLNMFKLMTKNKSVLHIQSLKFLAKSCINKIHGSLNLVLSS